MDAESLLENLKAELMCSICLGYFIDPVTVKCGHSFCEGCLLRGWEGADATLIFPECRGVIKFDNLIANKGLHNLSITGKMIRFHLLQSIGTCEQHGEKEKLFCEEDETSLCESCSLTPEHKDHQVLPLDRAANKYKNELQEICNILQGKEEEFNIALDKVRRNEECCKQDADAFKRSVHSEYKKMYQFLQNEEKRHLRLLDEESRQNLAKLEENKAELTQQRQKLQRMLLEIEEDLDKAPSKMLRNRKTLLQKKEELLFQKLEISSSYWSTCPITGLREVLKSFQRDVTLDPESANPHLILSKDLNCVECSSVPEDLPDKEERLEDAFSVLGAQTFNSGKHYWEVELGDNTRWEVGVCEDSVSRKGDPSTVPGDITALEGFKSGSEFVIWKSNEVCLLNHPIDKLGIFLDYENGHVAFYNVSEESLLYSPPNINFQGLLHPYFSLCIVNVEGIPASLIICPRSN